MLFEVNFIASYLYVSIIIYVHKNSDKFSKNIDVYNLNTRNRNKLGVLSNRLHKIRNSFRGNVYVSITKLP